MQLNEPTKVLANGITIYSVDNGYITIVSNCVNVHKTFEELVEYLDEEVGKDTPSAIKNG